MSDSAMPQVEEPIAIDHFQRVDLPEGFAAYRRTGRSCQVH